MLPLYASNDSSIYHSKENIRTSLSQESRSSTDTESLNQLRRSVENLNTAIENLTVHIQVLEHSATAAARQEPPKSSGIGSKVFNFLFYQQHLTSSSDWDILKNYDLMLLGTLFFFGIVIAIAVANSVVELPRGHSLFNLNIGCLMLLTTGLFLFGWRQYKSRSSLTLQDE